MNNSKIHDVVIVGAGPAGATAAYNCAKFGLDSVLIEAKQFPRLKACGGAVSEQALSYLDFVIEDKIFERDIFGARVRFMGNSLTVLKPYRIARIVTRSIFDNYLLRQAINKGAAYRGKEKVVKLNIVKEYVEIFTSNGTLKTKLIIGADGANSVCAKYVHSPLKKNEYGIGIVAHVPAENSQIDKFINNSIEICFGIVPSGYAWVFPHEKYFNVGIGGFADKIIDPKGLLRNFININKFDLPMKYYAHKIPAGGKYRGNISDRVILVGDAAGYVDSFYGEGIAYAILSGKIAAEVSASVLKQDKKPDRKTLNIYSYRCRHEFGNNLKYSLFLSRIMHKYPKIFLNLMATNSNVLERWLDVPGNKMSYKEFIIWLLPRIPLFMIEGTRLFKKR